jgi:hypothetical protein
MTETTAAVKPSFLNDKTAIVKTDIAAYVSESRAASGLPPTVEDEAALRQVAALLVVGKSQLRRPRRSA